MFRRRPRRAREIAFSLDSFLDVVANVVGIIIRLILVAWVGARSYKALIDLPPSAPLASAPLTEPDDPLQHALARQRQELRQTLRYHTPISRPVHLEELHFECQGGRVAFVDVAAFLAEMREAMREQSQTLRHQWQVEGIAGPIGPFRMHYVIERERGVLDGMG